MLLLTGLLLTGCGSISFPSLPSFSLPASGSIDRIIPGQTASREVEQILGKPAEIADVRASADKVWFYTYPPRGGVAHAVVIGPNGVVRAVEQRLTRENAKRIAIGRTGANEVRALLGPPLRVQPKPGLGSEEWMYRFTTVSPDPQLLHLSFSADRIVREMFVELDPVGDHSSSSPDLLQ